MRDRLAVIRADGQTPLAVGVGKRLLGIVVLADVIAPASREAVERIKALGVKTMLLSGDHRAIAERVARDVGIERVQAARVHLVLPERPLFSRDKVDASASIVLKVRGTLEPQQVRAIRHLVATAVNGLKPERVSVIDESGKLLADGATSENPLNGVSADERKLAYENRLRNEVEAIVSSVVGPGRARVQINADFDVNRITQTSDKFDPDGRVLRSSQTREEQAATTDNKEGSVSVGTEMPGGGRQQPQADGGARGDQSRKTEEIVNYEISRTTKTEVIEAGRVNRISAAVLVDGIYSKNDKGEVAYQPRPKEELDRIAALVRSAIGFDAKRGDQVEVVNLRFAETTPSPINEATGWMSYLQFTKDDIMAAAEKGVMLLLGLVVLFFVIRPLVRRVITPEGAQTPFAAAPATMPAVTADAATAAAAAGMTLPGVNGSITSTGGPNVSIVGGDEAVAISNRTSAMIDIAKVQGQVHAQSVQKVGELADKNPHEAVSIIRNWLHEDAA